VSARRGALRRAGPGARGAAHMHMARPTSCARAYAKPLDLRLILVRLRVVGRLQWCRAQTHVLTRPGLPRKRAGYMTSARSSVRVERQALRGLLIPGRIGWTARIRRGSRTGVCDGGVEKTGGGAGSCRFLKRQLQPLPDFAVASAHKSDYGPSAGATALPTLMDSGTIESSSSEWPLLLINS
jgi:hypothetical protein